MSVSPGEQIPDIELPATDGDAIRLTDYQGHNLVLFFYPKASTPGCTQEGRDFNAAMAQFKTLNTRILGVSRDGLKAQNNFKTKQGFSFELLSDKDETLCRLFDVIKLKKLYGRESLGIERSTFLIDRQGVLHKEWRKVKVKGHVQEVLAAVRDMESDDLSM